MYAACSPASTAWKWTRKFLAELKTMRLPARYTGNTAVDTGYRTIATYLSGADAHAMTHLAVDYVRAFIGRGIDRPCRRLPLRVGAAPAPSAS